MSDNRLWAILKSPALKWAYFGTLLGIAIYYLFRWGDRISDPLSRVEGGWIGLALLANGAAALLYVYIQYRVYRAVGASLSFPAAFKIVTLSQLGKYVPGKVLYAGNYYLLSREAGIGDREIGASFIISISLWILSASISGFPVISTLSPLSRYSIILLPLAIALLIHPRVLNYLFSLVERIAKRYGKSSAPPHWEMPTQLNPYFYLKIIGVYLLAWLAAGLGMYSVLVAFQPLAIVHFPICLAAIALATIGGFLVLFAPVGLGIREGIGTAILLSITTPEIALLSMIALRVTAVIVDITLALVSLIIRCRLWSISGPPRPPPR